MAADPEMRVRVNGAGGEYVMTDVVAFLPATVAFNFHLTPDRPFDVYLGPMIAWVLYVTEDWDHSPGWHHKEDRTEQDVAWGANLGFDVHFGDGPWWLTGTVRYLDTTLDLGDREIDYDPTVVGLGFGFRF
jgi:outer membrane protein W